MHINNNERHRLTEALYLGTIPVVKRCIAMEQFYDFPVSLSLIGTM